MTNGLCARPPTGLQLRQSLRSDAMLTLKARALACAQAPDSDGSPSGDAEVLSAALKGLKSDTGIALESTVVFSSDAQPLRAASRLGATPARLPAGARGPGAAALRAALGAHAAKLADSRGY